MLLNYLSEIADRGAKLPLSMWRDDFIIIGRELNPKLEKVSGKLQKNTRAGENVKALIAQLKRENPDEFIIAKAIIFISELFTEDVTTDKNKLVEDYSKNARRFFHRAQMNEFHHQFRDNISKTLSGAEQKKHDRRLFEQEGMMYCLEYYLAVYKAIQEADTESEKRWYIESQEIDLGFGDVPGLHADFTRDEVLDKFVYKILDEGVRARLLKAYFRTKEEMMKIEINCRKEGACEAVYDSIAVNDIINSFKSLISVLLDVFSEVGIKRLSSLFFKPYGSKPLIKDITL